MLVSLPTSISPSNNHDEALTAIRATVTNDYGTVTPFNIPPFKVGTLDILVQQADELAKLATSCEGVVGKVGDTLRIILEADEEKIQQQKMVNDRESCFKNQRIQSGRLGLTASERTGGPVPSHVLLEQSEVPSRQASGRSDGLIVQGKFLKRLLDTDPSDAVLSCRKYRVLKVTSRVNMINTINQGPCSALFHDNKRSYSSSYCSSPSGTSTC